MTRHAPRCWRIALACAPLLSTPAARAWGNLLLMEHPPEVSTLAVGPSVWVLPRYPGSGRSRTTVLPGVDYYAANGIFVSTDLGLGWNLSRRADLQGGVRVWPQFGRRDSESPPGVSGIGTRLQGQAFVNYAPSSVLLLQSGLLAGAGRHHDGVQLELGVTSGLPLGGDLLGIGLAASAANRAYRQSYFGISADESARGGVPAYGMGAGWQDVSLTFSSEHKFSPHWRLSGQLVLARLIGAAARSPLTASPRQTAATLTLWRDL